MFKRLTFLFAALVFISSAAAEDKPAGKAPDKPAPPAIAVTVAQPLQKKVRLWDEYSGRFEAVERVDLRARVSGFLDKIHFKDGQLVKAGDLLFTIDKRPYEIAVESAKADVARYQASVDFAKADVERAEPLAKSKFVSEQTFDQRKATLATNQAQVLAAQAALKNAELNLEWADVRSPVTGRISDRKIDVGNLIAGGQAGSTLLATIVSIDPIRFVFDVSETDYLKYSRLRISGDRPSSRDVANPVRLKLADEKDFIHDGKMDFVDNTFNERSGTLRGRAVFDNKEGILQPGLFARLALFGGDTEAFLIPDQAVVSDQARKIVFVVNADNVIAASPVTLGPIVEGLRLVKSGVTASDNIVIEGLANPAVRPGTKVAPTQGSFKSDLAAASKP